MDDSNTYGRMNMANQASHDNRRRTRKRIVIIGVSSIALIAIIAAVAVSAARSKSRSDQDGNDGSAANMPASIKAVCDKAVYPPSCYSSLSQAMNGSSFDLSKLYHASVEVAMGEVSRASALFDGLRADRTLDPLFLAAVDACKELLDLSYTSLNASASESSGLSSAALIDDFRTWLSAAMTYQDTCLDGFDNATVGLRTRVADCLRNSTEFSSNSLAILTQISGFLGHVNLRRLLSFSSNKDGFPSWLSARGRKLLQAPDLRAQATIVVAQDGTGKYRTIKEALEAVPAMSTAPTVVYVKTGTYKENVRVEKNKWNVVMIGDGKGLTVVTGSLNVVDGTPTFKSATFAVFGKGFVGRDMTFVNSAGPAKHQAVALMSDSDLSVFYRCSFIGNQDTLYQHTMRQFYRECDVVGTVDFIFGNAAVVLQSSSILPTAPMPGQQVTLTAQGRTDPNMNTGTVFHSCSVSPKGSLAGVRVYLGRPWKDYSRTVYMKTSLAGIIDPAGWLPWMGLGTPFQSTIYYGEFANTGPGASVAGRVRAKGVHSAMTAAEAGGFAVGAFLGGGAWLPATGVPFSAVL